MDAAAASQVLDPGLTGQDARPVEGVDNGYLAGYRVRFDEAGPDGNLRVSALLRYAQDVAWRHSEQLGFDRAWYQDRGLGWVVRGVELELAAPIPLGTTCGSPRPSSGIGGSGRAGWASAGSPDGRLAARVTTDWVLLDGRGRVVRIPDDFGVAFANPEVKSEILRVPAETGCPRLAASPDGPSERPRPDRPREQRGLRRLAGGGARGRRLGATGRPVVKPAWRADRRELAPGARCRGRLDAGHAPPGVPRVGGSRRRGPARSLRLAGRLARADRAG